MRKVFKPTAPKIFLAAFFLLVHILYSFQLLNIDTFTELLAYFPMGLSLIDWSNYFLMKVSYVVLWIVLGALIFSVLWGKELVSVLIANGKVKRSHGDQPKENYEELLKAKPFSFIDHVLPKIILASACLLFILFLRYGTGIVENVRYSTLNLLFMDMMESGTEVELNLIFEIASFTWIAPIWYFISALVVWFFELGQSKEKEEEIVENHFAVAAE